MEVLFQFLIAQFWNLWPFKLILPWERGLLIFWGRYVYEVPPGIWARIPLISWFFEQDIRETPFDCPHQYVQTMDAATVGVSANGTYEITDIKLLYQTLGEKDEAEWIVTIATGLLADYLTDEDTEWGEVTAENVAEIVRDQLQERAAKKGLNILEFFITHLSELQPYYAVLDGAGSEIDLTG